VAAVVEGVGYFTVSGCGLQTVSLGFAGYFRVSHCRLLTVSFRMEGCCMSAFGFANWHE